MQTGKARLICTTPTGGDLDGKMVVNITDEKSGTVIIELIVPYASMLKALTARHADDLDFTLYGEAVNCEKQTVKRKLLLPDRLSKDEAAEHLAEYETDGWRASRSDATNHHCWAGPAENGFRPVMVGFHRYIKPDGTPLT